MSNGEEKIFEKKSETEAEFYTIGFEKDENGQIELFDTSSGIYSSIHPKEQVISELKKLIEFIENEKDFI